MNKEGLQVKELPSRGSHILKRPEMGGFLPSVNSKKLSLQEQRYEVSTEDIVDISRMRKEFLEW